MQAILRSKDQRSLERKFENRFRAYLCQMWIELRQTKIKMIIDSFYTYRP